MITQEDFKKENKAILRDKIFKYILSLRCKVLFTILEDLNISNVVVTREFLFRNDLN